MGTFHDGGVRRNLAICHLIAGGVPFSVIARWVGVSRTRVAQVLRGYERLIYTEADDSRYDEKLDNAIVAEVEAGKHPAEVALDRGMTIEAVKEARERAKRRKLREEIVALEGR